MFETGVTFVYHRVPGNLVGGALYPLNHLARVHPEAAELHRAKYAGREAVTQARIPPLECLWNDVLMFSPIHPALLLEALRDSGRIVPTQRWYEVDASLLEPERTTLFAGPLERTDTFSSDDYLDFTPENLQAHCTASERTLERLRQALPGARVMMFADVPHVFYRGTLEVAKLRELEL